MEHFEEKIQKTKEILSKLNAQDLSLKESLALYKVGVEELKAAQAMLERAKAEYEEIKAQDINAQNANADFGADPSANAES